MKRAAATLTQQLTNERTELVAKRDALDARIQQIDAGLAGLRALKGEAPPPRPRRTRPETGTKALILDLLADGARRSSLEIAAALKVKRAGGFIKCLNELTASGDITRQGSSRATRYFIP